MRGKRPRVFAAAMAAAGVIAIGAGCGGGGGGGATSGGTANLVATPGISEQVNKKIAAEVPNSLKSKGTLTVAADATYPPNEFIKPNSNTVIGMDADLGKALAEVMGLNADVKNVTFNAILPGLAAHKYDLGMSSFTVTKQREKEVDFVSYANVGTFRVPVTPMIGLLGVAPAGEPVSTFRGAKHGGNMDTLLIGAGSKVFLPTFSDGAMVYFGDVHAAMGDGEVFLSGVYGIAMAKNSGLAKPVLDAVKQVMSDGTYDKIFKYWGLVKAGPSGCPCAINNPQINPTNVPVS